MEPDKKIPTNNTTPVSPIGNNHKVVKTLLDDMTHVLEDGKGGIIKRIIHSEEEHEAEKRNLSPQSKKNKAFMFLGMILILISLGTLFFFFQKRAVPSIPVDVQFIPIIFTDKNSLVEIAELKKAEISKNIFEKVSITTIKPREIEAIYPTYNKSPVGLRKFIASIEGNFIPTEMNFVDDNFLFGVVKNDNKSNSFFMMFKMRSIADVFGAMQSWESKMFIDLHGFFGVPLSLDTKYLLTKNFENGIVENKNARILYDNDNKIVLMYVFPDENHTIITNSENAVREITLRLTSSQIKK